MNVNLTSIEIDKEKQLKPLRISLWLRVLACVTLLMLVVGVVVGLPMLRSASVVYCMSPLRPPRIVRAYTRVFKHKPQMTDFLIQAGSGPLQIRMYTPQDLPNAPMIVLVHGFSLLGNQDVILNAVAVQLCHIGLRVVMPNIASEQMFRMSATAVAEVDDVVRWSAMTSGEKVSLFGISYSGGMVITAAAVPEYADYVKMIFCASGYNSIDRLGRYYLHDVVKAPDLQPYGETPPPGILSPMALQYLDELVSPDNIEPLTKPLLRIPRDMSPTQAAQPLTIEQRELLDDVLNIKTEGMRARYHALMERHRAELASISPMGKINEVHGALYLLHGYVDPVIPRGEAEWTQQEALHNANVRILITPWMNHAWLESPAPLREKLRVGYFISQMLEAALRPSPLPASRH